MWKVGIVALVLAGGIAHAEAAAFVGHWKNPDPKPSGLTHVVISPNGGDRVDVRAYGDCHPSECDWGMVQGKIYTTNPKSHDVAVIVATFHFGFAHREVTFHKGAGGKLQFEMLTDFDDGSDKQSFAVTGTLEQTGWAGPLAQVWQRQPGLTTGWGGGARSGSAPKPFEQCTVFDTRGATAVENVGMWSVVAGGRPLVRIRPLLQAGHDGKAAMIAAAAVRHYGFDRRCTVGGPWMAYWKAGDSFAGDKIGGVSCVTFHPTTAHLVQVGRDWTIVDGTAEVAKFAGNKPKAEATLALIRYHKLEALCFVRQADPIMMFWLARSGAQP
jgi:hypothetical protein